MKIIIIGTGLAGYMLAKEFRKLDKESELTIITKDDGPFYSKPLLSTALTQNKTAEKLAMFSAAQMAEQLNATILTQTVVTDIDAQNKTVVCEKGSHAYDKLVLATGAKHIVLPIEHETDAEIVAVNDLQQYAVFRKSLSEPQASAPDNSKRVAILGSGLVGCEFANDLINTDHHVSIIAPDHYPLARLVPEKIGLIVKDALAKAGVDWHLNAVADAIKKTTDGIELSLSNNETLQADMVLSAVGLKPNTDLAEQADLTINRGVVTNEFLQTSDASIYALGDCAEVNGVIKQYVAPILLCARQLAKTLTGETSRIDYPAMPIMVKTPTMPIVSCLPGDKIEGEWRYEGEGDDLAACFYNGDNALMGFVLSGKACKEKQVLLKALSLRENASA